MSDAFRPSSTNQPISKPCFTQRSDLTASPSSSHLRGQFWNGEEAWCNFNFTRVRGTTDEYSLAVNNFAPSLLNSQIPLLLCVVVFEVLKLLSEETLQFFDTKF